MAGRVTVVVLDNGATSVQVPNGNTQLVIGCCGGGVVGIPFASTSPSNILTTFDYGPLTEAMGLVAAVGGVPIGVKATTTTPGAASAVVATAGNTGTSVMTVTGTPKDNYFVIVTCTTAGTIATGPVGITVSLDAGRTKSPPIAMGTATTYAVPNTGVTLNFTSAAIGLGDTYTFGTTEPAWNAAGIQSAITAFLSSQYGKLGVGSIHIVGGSTILNGTVGATGSDMVSIGGYLQTARTNQFVFTRAYISARDTKVPVPYGGAAETDAAWQTAINTDFTGQSLNADTTGRTSVCAAYWNMQSQFVNGMGVAPRFRRSVAYAAAQRQVQIPPQRMPSRVKDGALAPIVISPADKSDGFNYHDESITPGLDTTTGGSGGHFSTTTTIQGKSGVYLQHANLFSPTGSVYGFMPQGLVIDIACSIAYQVGVTEIDNDVRLTPSGSMDPRDATTISNSITSAIANNMTMAGMLTSSPANPKGCTAVVDQQANVQATGNVPITVLVNGKGYILTETIGVGFQPPTGN